MDFSSNAFYNLKSKKRLFELLYIDESNINSVILNYKIYLIKNNDKGRIIEEPINDLKRIHKRIKQLLDKNISLELPNYILCKKNSSWMDVIKSHINSNYFALLDISKFFPSISFDMIVRLFTKYFKTSTVVARYIASFLTVDYDLVKPSKNVVEWFEDVNNVRKKSLPSKHLCTGSPVSVLISELASLDMFDEIKNYCEEKNLIFTTYVDDIQISSSNKIYRYEEKKILSIIRKYEFESNNKKIKHYNLNNDVNIIGVVKKGGTKEVTITYKVQNKLINLIKNNIDGIENKRIDSLLRLVKLIDIKKYKYFSNYFIQ